MKKVKKMHTKDTENEIQQQIYLEKINNTKMNINNLKMDNTISGNRQQQDQIEQNTVRTRMQERAKDISEMKIDSQNKNIYITNEWFCNIKKIQVQNKELNFDNKV
ncbi:8543_t:CDS:2 [Gigaspora margarita]|uniref:8543_t:CDS:1 n=1 Tax=Gigaspora margarita TaxID=4874 RepID=A0ABM8W3J4_GIGMA|nr:8543_t:CDS:2 [Gigaspora margarita]